MFPDIKNMVFSKILYFFLFPAVLFPSCRQGMTTVAQPPKPVPVYDMEKLPKASVYIQAEEKIMNLSLQQKQQLASYIIHSANWEKMLKKEFKQVRSGRYQEMLSMVHQDDDSYLNRVIIPYIRLSSKDKDILSLLQNNTYGEAILSRVDIFDLVAENYIEYFPDDKNGWDFFMVLYEHARRRGSLLWNDQKNSYKKASQPIQLREENTGYARQLSF